MNTNEIDRQRERKGNVCPHCGATIPPLTKTCPECGATVGTNETTADKELNKLVDQMEAAIVELKSADAAGLARAKAEVESLLRKAKTFYGNNPKVQALVKELESEMNSALVAHKSARNKEIGASVGKRLIWVLMWAGLVLCGCACLFFPFRSYKFRGALGDLWRRMIGGEPGSSSSISNSYLKEFEEKLNDLERRGKENQVAKLLQSTRVPDNREGLLEMLGILEPRLTSQTWTSDLCHHEFVELYKKTLNKARRQYSNDTAFQYYFNARTDLTLAERILG